MDLLSYLKNNYQKGELIFQKDINVLSSDNVRQQRKSLSDERKIIRYQRGVYLLPRKDKDYGIILPSRETYLYSSYLSRRGHHFGYYDAKTQLIQAGLLKQENNSIVCFSNETSIKKETDSWLILPSKVEITDWNYKVLSLLELLSKIEDFNTDRSKIQAFLKERIRNGNIQRIDRDFYASNFSLQVYKSIFDYSLATYIH